METAPDAVQKAPSWEPDPGARCMMAAVIAAGVIQIDSTRHEHPDKVAELALEVADHIIALVQADVPAEEPAAPEQQGDENG